MWYTLKDNHIEIKILAKPNAKKSQVVGLKADRLHVAIHAQPQDGEANAELIHFLAKLFGVPKNQVNLKSGVSSRYKLVTSPLTLAVRRLINRLE